MDRVKRKIASELLHTYTVGIVHLLHEIYRVAHHQRDGLTDKEYAFLMTRHKALEQERVKLSKLTDRLRKTS